LRACCTTARYNKPHYINYADDPLRTPHSFSPPLSL
jgi:hypothetical protein